MSEKVREQLREAIRRIFKQITEGCGRPVCSNPKCASNPEMDRVETLDEAKKLSTKLGAEYLKKSPQQIKLCEPPPPYFSLSSIRHVMQKSVEQQDFVSVTRYIGEIFANSESLNQSFLKEKLAGIAGEDTSGVDLEEAAEGLKLFHENSGVSDRYMSAVHRCLVNIKQELRYSRSSFENPENLRQFIVLLQDPNLFDPFAEKDNDFIVPFASCVCSLPSKGLNFIIGWMSEFPVENITFFLSRVQIMLSMRAIQSDVVPILHKDEIIHWGTEFLKILFTVNKNKGEPISYVEFYNDALNERLSEREELAENCITWFKNRDGLKEDFTLCSFEFMLNPLTKSRMLLYDSRVQQYEQRQMHFFRRDFVLRVEREHLVQSALAQVELYLDDVTQFKKQLRVKFEGEEGIDEGGVQKEFFQLIVRELFDANYGMFTLNKETHCYWICHTSEDTREFLLIGIILGLAIYNGVILDVHFPTVLYKKLMSVPVTFEDVKELQPTVYSNLKKLLDYKGEDMEDVFCLNFEVMYDYYGHSVTHDLIENGASIAVNQSNKQQYVDLYTQWLLVTSVEKQFNAFLTGFKHVCDGVFFELFRVEEVELLICGDPELDFKELESITEYDGGFDKDNEVIRNFWDVLHDFNEEQKKQFLFFTTGSDRAPIGGLKNMRFIITKHGDDNDRLPQAHTCFNVLLLPPYASKEKLKEKLLLATQNATGFGML